MKRAAASRGNIAATQRNPPSLNLPSREEVCGIGCWLDKRTDDVRTDVGGQVLVSGVTRDWPTLSQKKV
jgi:hypothetical protein